MQIWHFSLSAQFIGLARAGSFRLFAKLKSFASKPEH
jgi:hypothetical protein